MECEEWVNVPEYMVRQFATIKTKQYAFMQYKESIHTICFGSSHAAYAFLPQYFSPYSFNFGTVSQDLYSTNLLYQSCAQYAPNLKNILLCLSVFSQGFHLLSTKEIYLCHFLSFICGCTYPMKRNQSYDALCAQLNERVSLQENDRGFCDYRFLDRIPLAIRVRKHLRENRRKPHQIHNLDILLANMMKNNHNLYIILMPARSDYRMSLPKAEVLFGDIVDWSYMHGVPCINFYDPHNRILSKQCMAGHTIADEYFYDTDHLNLAGAQQYTHSLRRHIVGGGVESIFHYTYALC